jgi:predicted permease
LIGNLPAVRALRTSYPTPEIQDVELSGSTVLLTVVASLACLGVAALISTWRLWRTGIHADLKAQKTGRTRSIARNALVSLQVALSVVLVAGAVLTGKTFWNLEHTNAGFQRTDLVEVTVDPAPAGYSDDQARTFHTELQRRIAELPGVRSAASSWSEIMRGVGMKTTVSPAGVVLPRNTFMNVSANFVSEHYFTTLGIPFLAGRDLQPGDDEKRPQPLVVNTAFVKLFFPGQNPIGKFIVSGTSDGRKAPTGVIVGLVGTAKYRTLREENPPIAYSLEKPGMGNVFYARSRGNPAYTLQAIRALVRQMDPRVPIAQATTMEEKVQGTLWQEKLLTALANFFGLIAVVLAAAGVYGTLSYSVTVRKRELGIRIAMGASTRDVLKSVAGRLGAAVAVGVGVGVIVSSQLLAIVRQLLFGVNLLDPSVVLLTVGVILIPAVIAATIPAFRAIRIDPAAALRTE